MIRDIVVFEVVDEGNDTAELDFRLIRQSLPSGACPLAIVNGQKFIANSGQYHTSEEVEQYARIQSGYKGD